MLRPVIFDVGYEFLDPTNWTAILSEDDDWWIGWVAELPGVNAQERTRDALLKSLAEVLAEALRMNRDQARAQASEGYEQVPLALRGTAISDRA